MARSAATGWMRKFNYALTWIENLLVMVAAICVLAMMIVTGADVLMRYVLGAPFSWAFDLLTRYLLIAAFFCSFGYTLRVGGHVAVDYFIPKWPARLRGRLLGAAYLLASVIVLVICWVTAVETVEAWRSDEIIAGVIEWPVWLSKIIVPIGLAPLSLRLLVFSLRAMGLHIGHEGALGGNAT